MGILDQISGRHFFWCKPRCSLDSHLKQIFIKLIICLIFVFSICPSTWSCCVPLRHRRCALQKSYFKTGSFQSNRGNVRVQTTINYFNYSGNFIHDAAVTWVENVNLSSFDVCALKAGRLDRLTPDGGLTFVDFIAFQEAPKSSTAGQVIMTKSDRNLRNFTLKWTKLNTTIILSTLPCIEKSEKCEQLPERTTKTVSYRKLEENSNSRYRQLGANKKIESKILHTNLRICCDFSFGNNFASDEI